MDYFDKAYREKQSLLTKLSWQKGEHDFLRKSAMRICSRKECTNQFKTIPSDPKKYCSQNCAAIVCNTGRRRYPPKKERFCLNCRVSIVHKHSLKYCSTKCQVDYRYYKYIQLWKEGIESGTKGVTTKSLCAYIRRYLIEKFDNKCSRCAWNVRHPITGNISIEVEHIDGNSENNKEENLTLLCPNCHSLTTFYKNLNKGRGRKWRMDKYIKNS